MPFVLPFFRFWARVDEASVRRRLQGLAEWPAPDVESVLVENGHVLITVAIDARRAQALLPVTERAEQLLRRMRGVRSARVILTAERAPPAHTAIKMASAGKAGRPLAPDADPDLARILEATPDETGQAARDAAYLLSGGLERRRAVRLDSLDGGRGGAPERGATREAARRAQREATFRYVVPEE